MSDFEKELADLINKNSLENDSGTPDYILAKYLQGCLDNFNETIMHRARHNHKTPSIIYVNSKKQFCYKKWMDYYDIVILAGHDPKKIWTVTYKYDGEGGGTISKREGITIPIIEVKDGMSFSVIDTSKS